MVGASSWEFMKDYDWAYGERPAWLVTHNPDPPRIDGADMRVFSGDVADLVGSWRQPASSESGSSAAATSSASSWPIDRIDEVIITLAPTFLGRGPALADGEFPLRRFRLVDVNRAGEREA